MWVQFPSWCKGSVPSSHARGLGFKPHWRKYSFHFMDIEQPSLYCACFVENCQTGPNKRENRNVGTVIRLFVSYLFGYKVCSFYTYLVCFNQMRCFFINLSVI